MKYPPFTHDRLHGIWTALPTPWKKNGRLDRGIYAADVARCCKAGVHGVYSGGTTGEFYSQDFKLFCEINELLTATAHDCGTPIQAGCTALDTAEACRRVAFARRIRADIIQIALPFWLALDDREVVDFFVAVAKAAGDIPIVHYDTGRSKRRISPGLYRQIRKRVPTLWGTKFGGSDVWEVKQIVQANPGLKVFVGEHILASATPMGATGSYSSVVMVNPAWMLGYYEACRSGDWERAFRVQDEIAVLFEGFEQFVTPNLQDTAIDRILGRLSGFVKCPLEAKPPYRHGREEDLRRLRAWARKKLPHILELAD